MSTVDEFTKKLSSDPAFAQKIKNCKTSAEIIAASKEAGIILSDMDLARTLGTNSPQMTEEELESVSKGGVILAAALIK
jgi:predicted ribosomally synthesized peptide with nif11-like leader